MVFPGEAGTVKKGHLLNRGKGGGFLPAGEDHDGEPYAGTAIL